MPPQMPPPTPPPWAPTGFSAALTIEVATQSLAGGEPTKVRAFTEAIRARVLAALPANERASATFTSAAAIRVSFNISLSGNLSASGVASDVGDRLTAAVCRLQAASCTVEYATESRTDTHGVVAVHVVRDVVTPPPDAVRGDDGADGRGGADPPEDPVECVGAEATLLGCSAPLAAQLAQTALGSLPQSELRDVLIELANFVVARLY